MDDKKEKSEDQQMKLALQDVLDENWSQLKTIIKAPQKVVVTDINMSFGSMITFMVKWAIASIPALIILIFIGSAVMGILANL
jgi:multidrug resistance efflux pump